jgi:hypothetical protein
MGPIRAHHVAGSLQEDADASIPVARILAGELSHDPPARHGPPAAIDTPGSSVRPTGGRTRGGSTGPARGRRRPAAGARVRPPSVSGDLLEDVDPEILVGHHLLQPPVFALELPHSLDVGRVQRAEVFAPAEDRLRANAVTCCRVSPLVCSAASRPPTAPFNSPTASPRAASTSSAGSAPTAR